MDGGWVMEERRRRGYLGSTGCLCLAGWLGGWVDGWMDVATNLQDGGAVRPGGADGIRDLRSWCMYSVWDGVLTRC